MVYMICEEFLVVNSYCSITVDPSGKQGITMNVSGQLVIKKCEFTWKLENFSKKCKQVADIIYSPIFEIEGSKDFKWQLELYPYGENDSSQGYLSLYLYNETQVNINVCFKIILSDVNDIQIDSRTTQHTFNLKDSRLGYGWSLFIKRDILLQGLLDDVLNINCIIYKDMYSEQEMDMDKKILNDYESLFLDENSSDLTIIINDKYIKAHKSILSARSKVFAAMFNHDMKENNTNTITIIDVNYDIMEEMLLFVYSGNVKNLMKNAKDLLAVANKYEIMELVVLCEKSLCRNVKIEDACEILSIADTYNCSELKAAIIEFTIANIKEISNTSGFKNLIRSNPELFEEVFAKILPLVVQKKQ